MTHERIVYMANQIARAFKAKGEDAAIAETAAHIKSFWDPRMRAQLAAHLAAGGAGLDAVAKQAAEQLSRAA
jgi:formate dehydrogenase subunit delta